MNWLQFKKNATEKFSLIIIKNYLENKSEKWSCWTCFLEFICSLIISCDDIVLCFKLILNYELKFEQFWHLHFQEFIDINKFAFAIKQKFLLQFNIISHFKTDFEIHCHLALFLVSLQFDKKCWISIFLRLLLGMIRSLADFD